MADSFFYKLRSGKPSKFLFFTRGYAGLLVPSAFYRNQLHTLLEKAKARPDYDYMLRRRDYYIRLRAPFAVSEQDSVEKVLGWCHYVGPLKGFLPKTFHSAYFIDQHDVTRYFPPMLRWSYCPGDVYFTPTEPTVVKSRLLEGDNSNSVLLKLDKLRHFIFLRDRIPFRQKLDKVIFRGKIRSSRVRTTFLEKFFDHELVDAGVVERNDRWNPAWTVPKKTLLEHLDYKFIMALEGNDVASNLKMGDELEQHCRNDAPHL